MADEILIKFSVSDDGSPVIERVNKKLGETKEKSNALVPGLESARKSLTGFVGDNAAAIGVLVGVGAALKNAFDVSQKYAGAVRDLALASGTGAEESSRLLQVLDDYQISAEDVTAATRAMKEKGLVPTIGTLADLADKYNAIQDPAEKLEFAQDNLGRASQRFFNVLSQGGDALRKQNSEVSKSLILTDEQIKKSEKARLAVDALNDEIEGAKIGLGSWVGEMIVSNDTHAKAIEILKAEGAVVARGVENTQAYRDVLRQMENAELAAARSAEAHGAALDGDIAIIEKATEATSRLNMSNKEMIDFAIAQTEANENQAESQKDILEQIDEYQAKLEEVFPWETEKRDEILGQIDELKNKYAEDAAAFEEAQAKKAALMAIEKIAMLDGVEGFSLAEQAKALAVANTLGVIEGAALRETIAIDAVTSAIAEGTIKAEDMDRALRAMESGYTIDVVINTIMQQQNVTNSGSANYVQQLGRNGFAEGGISRGSDSGHWELLHGTEAVIPLKNGSVPVSMQGGAGGGGVSNDLIMMMLQALPDAIARSNRAMFEKAGRR